MSDTETPAPEYKAPPLGAYPPEEHRAAQLGQTFPEGAGGRMGQTLHPDGLDALKTEPETETETETEPETETETAPETE